MSGEGGRRAEGRWNSIGQPIVYTAESSALAMLEVLVGLGTDLIPPTFQLLRIDCPDDLAQRVFVGTIAPPRAESHNWGDEWITRGEAPLASVPSAVAPHGRNLLINPAHPDAARISIIAKSRWPWDKRLFR
ncbi:MAG: RES family NAD+ phosphorylase [Sphingomonas sp.]|nr:RES family NAD+ phosphorylase [Sphingomonas sp.]